jgi:hypothetical protein
MEKWKKSCGINLISPIFMWVVNSYVTYEEFILFCPILCISYIWD